MAVRGPKAMALGGLSRWQGLVLVVAYAAFVIGHVLLR